MYQINGEGEHAKSVNLLYPRGVNLNCRDPGLGPRLLRYVLL